MAGRIEVNADLDLGGFNMTAGGLLMPVTTGVPPTPPADTARLFSRRVAGRVMPAFIGPLGQDSTIQPHTGTNRVATWQAAGASATVTVTGGAAMTSIGTATATTIATTNVHLNSRRVDHLVTVAAANAVAGYRQGQNLFSVGGVRPVSGGFHYVSWWGPATGVAIATHRSFTGLRPAAAPTDVEPSTLVNIVGMGWDAADANVQMMHNDATGVATKIDLGSGFPVPTADRTDWYRLSMFSPPGTTQIVQYEVLSLANGAVATGTITTDLPPTSALLQPIGWMSVGGTSSVIGYAFGQLYIETDN